MLLHIILLFFTARTFLVYYKEKSNLKLATSFLVISMITYLIGIIYSLVASFTSYNNTFLSVAIMLVGVGFMMAGVLTKNAAESTNKRKIQKRGIKTYGILTNITPVQFSQTKGSTRELILEFDYQKKNGTSAKGEIKEFIKNAIESRLNKGMILPVIYYDEKPGTLTFEKDLDYDVLEEGEAMAGQFKQNSF